MEALSKIQSELVAPKDLYNKFGNYYYRSAESILEAVKPLLAKYNAQLTITDDVVSVGDRVYVKASADFDYYVVIKSITKGQDDDSIPLNGY